MGESAVIGIIGAGMGIVLGFGGAALVDAISPKVTADSRPEPRLRPGAEHRLRRPAASITR